MQNILREGKPGMESRTTERPAQEGTSVKCGESREILDMSYCRSPLRCRRINPAYFQADLAA